MPKAKKASSTIYTQFHQALRKMGAHLCDTCNNYAPKGHRCYQLEAFTMPTMFEYQSWLKRKEEVA